MTAVHSYDPETRTSANSPLPPRRHMAGNSPDAANTRESGCRLRGFANDLDAAGANP
jgi:hypothetical protein